MGKDKLQEIIEKYEASDDELDLENRLRYAMALSMHFGKEVNTPEMKSILTTLTASGHQTTKKIKVNLLQLFIIPGASLPMLLPKKYLRRISGCRSATRNSASDKQQAMHRIRYIACRIIFL